MSQDKLEKVGTPKSADEWLDAVHREFERESDRAAGIVVGAMLDEALRTLLERRVIAGQKDRDILSGPRAPLGTFSARIDAAYQLGLISSFLARDLHLVRDIRNVFSHQPIECTFDRQDIKDRVRALEEASDYNRRRPDLRSIMGPPGPRGDFLGITAWMLFAIHRHAEAAQRIRPCTPEFGYIDWEKLPPDVRKYLEAESDD